MKQARRFFRVRVISVPDQRVVYFLIEEVDRRLIEESTVDLLASALLCVIDTLGVQTVKKATFLEVDASTFLRSRADEIPAHDVPGMRFWWMKQSVRSRDTLKC